MSGALAVGQPTGHGQYCTDSRPLTPYLDNGRVREEPIRAAPEGVALTSAHGETGYCSVAPVLLCQSPSEVVYERVRSERLCASAIKPRLTRIY